MIERARPPTRDDIARAIARGIDIRAFDSRDETTQRVISESFLAAADALLAEFSIVARGHTPPAPTCAHEWKVDLSFPVLAVNPPVYTYRCARCDALADSIYLAPRGVTSDPQTADAAFEKWWAMFDHGGTRVWAPRDVFAAGWNARAAVGDRPPTP